MRISLTERFQRDVAALNPSQRLELFEAMLGLPKALRDPHRHAGLGIRKLHASGIWEARLGLALRLVFTLASDTATLVRVGDHDEIRRWIKSI
jgi:mRNA-degrading endonuclease YafQ of YafQ-DinJ toxin-antitoxin module